MKIYFTLTNHARKSQKCLGCNIFIPPIGIPIEKVLSELKFFFVCN